MKSGGSIEQICSCNANLRETYRDVHFTLPSSHGTTVKDEKYSLQIGAKLFSSAAVLRLYNKSTATTLFQINKSLVCIATTKIDEQSLSRNNQLQLK